MQNELGHQISTVSLHLFFLISGKRYAFLGNMFMLPASDYLSMVRSIFRFGYVIIRPRALD